MSKEVRAILAGISLAIVIFDVHACDVSRGTANTRYRGVGQMTKNECSYLNGGKKELKEMKHLAKRVWIRK